MGNGKQKGKISSLLCKLDGLNASGNLVPLNDDQIKKYENSLWKNIDACLPKYLYKYRSFDDKTYDNLCNDRVYLNMPENYNDPTDSIAFIDANGVIEYISSLFIQESNGTQKNSVIDHFGSEENLAMVLRMNNNAIDTIFSIRKRIKVACFSEIISSSLMWSHYADNHRGFALRYNMDNTIIKECEECKEGLFCHRREFPFFPAIYKESRCDVSLYAIARAIYREVDDLCPDDIPIPILPLLQKSEAWSYENEWRLICLDKNQDYVRMKADAVYLGSQIEYESALKIMRVAREKGMQIYKMKIDFYNRQFELKYSEWTDWTDDDVEGWYYPNGKQYKE